MLDALLMHVLLRSVRDDRFIRAYRSGEVLPFRRDVGGHASEPLHVVSADVERIAVAATSRKKAASWFTGELGGHVAVQGCFAAGSGDLRRCEFRAVSSNRLCVTPCRRVGQGRPATAAGGAAGGVRNADACSDEGQGRGRVAAIRFLKACPSMVGGAGLALTVGRWLRLRWRRRSIHWAGPPPPLPRGYPGRLHRRGSWPVPGTASSTSPICGSSPSREATSLWLCGRGTATTCP